MDARSVKATDLVRVVRVDPRPTAKTRIHEFVAVQAAAIPGEECTHEWYWMSDQTEDDLLVIKLYDSKIDKWEDDTSEPIGCSPHVSIELPDSGSGEPRQSIEMRVGIILRD